MKPQTKLLNLARNIGRRKTTWGKRNAVLKWCEEAKRFLNNA